MDAETFANRLCVACLAASLFREDSEAHRTFHALAMRFFPTVRESLAPQPKPAPDPAPPRAPGKPA